MATITNGKADYSVERATEGSGDTFFLTGARGASYVAAPYVNNQDLYHAWSLGGRDLKDSNGRIWQIPKTDLETACN